MTPTPLLFPDCPELPNSEHASATIAASDQTRTIQLADRLLPYVLRRAKRRTIGLTIDHRGLRINAPARSSLGEIEGLIRQHEQWVFKKLDTWETRQATPAVPIIDGVKIAYLGQFVEIRLALGRHPPLWNEANFTASLPANLSANLPESPPTNLPETPPSALTPHIAVLTLFLRTPVQAAFFLEKALREKAFALFRERLRFYGQVMHLNVPKLTLSAAKTRWGSCSKRTGIRLNWRLIHFPLAIIDYVVIHELAHLREMNHSPRYWKIVEEICPAYRRHREDLKHLSATIPTW